MPRLSRALSFHITSLLCAAAVAAGCATPSTEARDPELEAARQPPEGSRLYGMFAGRVPCEGADECRFELDKVKIGLWLYADAADAESDVPTRYRLERVPLGERVVTEGTWALASGTADDAGARVVLLDEQTPSDYRRYQQVGNDILLVLDDTLRTQVGNAAWSFTLSRIE